jgi:hypothetical protein
MFGVLSKIAFIVGIRSAARFGWLFQTATRFKSAVSAIQRARFTSITCMIEFTHRIFAATRPICSGDWLLRNGRLAAVQPGASSG